MMKQKLPGLPLFAAGAILLLTLSPGGSLAQSAPAPAANSPELTAALLQLTAQQATLVDNQTKIDTRIAAIAEELRLARIFVSRGGQK